MGNNTQEEQDLDWESVFEYAKKHDLQPIISFQCREIVPEHSNLYLRQISRYVALKRELSNIEQLLSGIPYALVVYTALKYGILREHCKLTPL